MRAWLLLRFDLGTLIHYHTLHHVNTFVSPHFASLVQARYSSTHVRAVVDTLIATFGKLVGQGGTTSHLSLELSHLLQEHASKEQVAAALSEPRFLLHLVASSEAAGGSAHIGRMWSALTDRQKRVACTAAYRVLMATIPQLSGKKLKRVLDQSAAIASFVDRMRDKELALDLFNQSLRVQVRRVLFGGWLDVEKEAVDARGRDRQRQTDRDRHTHTHTHTRTNTHALSLSISISLSLDLYLDLSLSLSISISLS